MMMMMMMMMGDCFQSSILLFSGCPLFFVLSVYMSVFLCVCVCLSVLNYYFYVWVFQITVKYTHFSSRLT